MILRIGRVVDAGRAVKAIVEERLSSSWPSGFGDGGWVRCYPSDVVAKENRFRRRGEPSGVTGFQNDCTSMEATQMKEEGGRAHRVEGLFWRKLEEDRTELRAEVARLFEKGGEVCNGCGG